ncbi:Gibberellin-regulated family protein [Arabidopsis thaliana]|uniref:Gibberellin-regulated family protein n=1 Tax=Arabidopsis thaliana TaxID=3702 RepID=A0A1P8B308_ARATH|nr:Gibberellin-regulated family protein [Arabidopsis thaliana]ANM63290.1 Gibberellin-regulated family protein [Arabidopsis thaliana]|eukprot:NP_001325387.1 Gibberellin-regulated family protein [Arabidopsis thaliana]
MQTSNDAPKIDCNSRCQERCSLSSRPNLCHRACGTCCARCNCVAPGTSGNYDKCPCYGSLTTHGGRRKCP